MSNRKVGSVILRTCRLWAVEISIKCLTVGRDGKEHLPTLTRQLAAHSLGQYFMFSIYNMNVQDDRTQLILESKLQNDKLSYIKFSSKLWNIIYHPVKQLKAFLSRIKKIPKQEKKHFNPKSQYPDKTSRESTYHSFSYSCNNQS